MGWNAWSIGTKVMTVAGTGVAATTPAIVVPIVLTQQNQTNPIVTKMVKDISHRLTDNNIVSQVDEDKIKIYVENENSYDSTYTANGGEKLVLFEWTKEFNGEQYGDIKTLDNCLYTSQNRELTLFFTDLSWSYNINDKEYIINPYIIIGDVDLFYLNYKPNIGYQVTTTPTKLQAMFKKEGEFKSVKFSYTEVEQPQEGEQDGSNI